MSWLEGFDPVEFQHEIDIIVDNVEKMTKEVAYRAAQTTMHLVVEFSPVWSGSYILSHRIGINGETDSGPTNRNPYIGTNEIPPKVDNITESGYRNKAGTRVERKIRNPEKLPPKGKLLIYNNCPHAVIVENIPDEYLTGDMNPYMPYTKASLHLEGTLALSIKNAELKFNQAIPYKFSNTTPAAIDKVVRTKAAKLQETFKKERRIEKMANRRRQELEEEFKIDREYDK